MPAPTRRLEPALRQWFDKKLATNGIAQHAIDSRDSRLLFRCAAEACVGIREQGGNNRGAMVELIQETVGRAEGEAWCMSFVQSCIAYAEERIGWRSLLPVSEHCLTVFNQAPAKHVVKHLPLPGAIVIWRHGSTGSGHTGVVIEVAPDGRTFRAVEGNTESGIVGSKVERDGGGVYLTQRSMKATGNMIVVGFLKPFLNED